MVFIKHFQWVYHLYPHHRDCQSNHLPTDKPNLDYFKGLALSQDDYFNELCFKEVAQSFSIYTGIEKKKQTQTPLYIWEKSQSTKCEWMQQNCKWTVGNFFFFFFWEATSNSQYILPCGFCCWSSLTVASLCQKDYQVFKVLISMY